MAKITKTGAAGLKLIQSFEGWFAKPYNDPLGYATVGWGHLLHYSNVTQHDRNDKWLTGQKTKGVLTRAEGDELLLRDLDRDYEPTIEKLNLPLNQNQFDALVSFIYNCGVGAVAASTTVGRRLRAHNFRGAADAMLAWNKGGGKVLAGLTRRRKAERALFLAPSKTDPYDFLTPTERAKVDRMQKLRKAKSNTSERTALKTWMREQANELTRLPGGITKAHRKERIEYLRDVAFYRIGP